MLHNSAERFTQHRHITLLLLCSSHARAPYMIEQRGEASVFRLRPPSQRTRPGARARRAAVASVFMRSITSADRVGCARHMSPVASYRPSSFPPVGDDGGDAGGRESSRRNAA